MTLEARFAKSKFLQRIKRALDAHTPFSGTLRVSVADEPRWEASSAGDQVLVRWACWSLELGGREVTEPEFEVLGTEATRDLLAGELPVAFPGVQVVVDNDIDV